MKVKGPLSMFDLSPFLPISVPLSKSRRMRSHQVVIGGISNIQLGLNNVSCSTDGDNGTTPVSPVSEENELFDIPEIQVGIGMEGNQTHGRPQSISVVTNSEHYEGNFMETTL